MEDVASLAQKSEIIILSLFDGAAVTAVVTALTQCDLSDKLIVDTSTVGPDTLQSRAEAIARAQGEVLDAPIAGGPNMVLAGTAGIYIGGEASAVARFRPVAASFANRIHHVGPLGHGVAAKAITNMMLIGYWQCLKEALQLGRRCGLSTETMVQILSGSPAANGALASRIPIILGQSDAVGFSVAGVVKDASLFKRMAEQHAISVPALDASLASFRAHQERGYGEDDLCSMVRFAHEQA